jgi:hypothetical protein
MYIYKKKKFLAITKKKVKDFPGKRYLFILHHLIFKYFEYQKNFEEKLWYM